MDRIQVLPDLVINQIAAGEVVERPASVVKELVENSLDAGATDIRIELEDGGRKRITIVDNGSGMNPRDAERALLRHATSKIHSLEDLFSARSLGFRGEALASIAAVSKFSLTTCEQGASVGVRHTLTGGEEKSSQSLSAQGGTSVTVAELFFNIPARKSFLKGAATEFGYCMELIQAMALSRPDVRFVLVHNGKEQLAAPAVAGAGQQGGPTPAGESTLRARAAMIFGEKTASSLVYMHKTSPHGSVEGLVSPPGVERPSGRDMFTFVNGRWVREKTLKYAVLRGYHSHMMRGKYPVVIINVTLDPSLVDVNVHPAKTEVRFQYASELQGLVAIGIREAMRQGAWAAPSPVDVSAPGEAEKATHEISSLSSSSSSLPAFLPPAPGRPRMMPSLSDSGFETSGTTRRKMSFDFERPERQPQALPFDEFLPTNASPADEATKIPWSELEPIGAYDKCYLFFDAGEQLLVVDQHAFHERIVFERLLKDRQILRRTQALLVPESLVLRHGEIETLKARAQELAAVGFTLQFASETTVDVLGVPAILAGRDIDSVMTTLARPEETSIPTEDAGGLAQDILATIACHSAVRAGESLGESELKQLLREASAVDFYHNCPHGRRVFKWWKRTEVARWFDR